MTRKHYYHVYIDKCYYPKRLHPKGITCIYKSWKILASGQIDAVNKVWEKYENEILSNIRPWVIHVSLNVGRTLVKAGRGTPPVSKLIIEIISNRNSAC